MQWLKKHRNVQSCFLLLFVCVLSLTVNAVTVRANGNKEPIKDEAVCRVGDVFEIYLSDWLEESKEENRKLSWSSSNDTIVEVDDSYNGLNYCEVKAKKLGTAIITATSMVDKSIKFQCKVSVMNGVYSKDGCLVLDKSGNLTSINFASVEGAYRNKVKKTTIIVTETCTSLEEKCKDYAKLTQVEIVTNGSNRLEQVVW